jgi:hypothetical protein
MEAGEHPHSLAVWARLLLRWDANEYCNPPLPAAPMRLLDQEARVVLLAERVAAGLHLWHPFDSELRFRSPAWKRCFLSARRKDGQADARLAVQAKGGGGSAGARQGITGTEASLR